MKKSNFVSLILGAIGGILFAIGMCMCLVPEMQVGNGGVVLGVIGAVVLLAMLVVRRKMEGKPPIKISGKVILTVAVAIIGALALGVGMCMTMVWQGLMVQGILVGLVGFVILLALIPLCKGIQ